MERASRRIGRFIASPCLLGLGVLTLALPALTPRQAEPFVPEMTTTFPHAGVYQFGVPGGVTLIEAHLVGADGASGAKGRGGEGGIVSGFVPVAPCTTLTVTIGSGGFSTQGGSPGGGAGASSMFRGGGGGGASELLDAARQPLLIAGGGGGGGGGTESKFNQGGSAFALSEATISAGRVGIGLRGGGNGGFDAGPGFPGTGTEGGAGGTGGHGAKPGALGTKGSSRQGGAGGLGNAADLRSGSGGGGGGGYFGGGGGGGSPAGPTDGGGGGAGSSFAIKGATHVSFSGATSHPPDGHGSITVMARQHLQPC